MHFFKRRWEQFMQYLPWKKSMIVRISYAIWIMLLLRHFKIRNWFFGWFFREMPTVGPRPHRWFRCHNRPPFPRRRTAVPGLATNSIFFCFLFVKNHWFAWRANQWPLIGETLFSSVPPSNSLDSVSDPWRAFWADTAPFKGPRLASCVACGTTEIKGCRQVWWRS